MENAQQTGSVEKALGNNMNNPYLWSVSYYDNHG